MSKTRGIIWFRKDLRLHDNEALTEALSACDEVIPLFVFDDRIFKAETSYGFDKTGRHRRRFFEESVNDLKNALEKRGSTLYVFEGITEDIIFDLARQMKTKWVFCNRERMRTALTIQDAVEQKLWSIGQEMRYSRGKMLVYTADLPFPVTHTPDRFSVFKKETRYIPIRAPLSVAEDIPTVSLNHISTPANHTFLDVEEILNTSYHGGETVALDVLNEFIENEEVNSESEVQLSPWISAGCLSPKHVYYQIQAVNSKLNEEVKEAIKTKLLRRDHFRFIGKKYGRLIFDSNGISGIPVNKNRDEKTINAWCSGQTGNNLIDAAMHALDATGWISFRLREIVSSYFIHELDQDWLVGAEYFESVLIDYDPCSNYGNWNRIAGVGAEHHEEIHFNLEFQQKSLDPDGSFVSKWL